MSRPIDADALLDKFLRAYTEQEKIGNFMFAAAEIKQNFADMIEEAPTIQQPEWISVDDRLPVEGVSIEMYYPTTQSICLGYYREIASQAFWCVKLPDGTGRVTDEKPTHWRYRYIEEPQPPKECE